MARKLKITVTSASNLVVMQDYDSTTLEIYKILNCGTGEFTLEQSGSVDLTAAGAMLTFVHKSGARFGAVKITDVESVTINGVAATITNLSLVRDAVAPYFFNVAGSGFAYYTEIDIPADQLLGNAPYTGVSDLATGIPLLPDVAGSYYDWRMNWEFTYGTTTYSLGGSAFTIKCGTSIVCQVNGSGIVFTQNRYVSGLHPEPATTGYHVPFLLGKGLILTTVVPQNAITGDGTLKLKIWYNVITP